TLKTMEKVKKSLQKLKDGIEAAEQRETDAKNAIKELDAKVDKFHGEKTTLESRIKVVQDQIDKIEARLEESEKKLQAAIDRTEHSEVRRKELAETEVDDFERSEEVENALKATAIAKESAGQSVVESKRKVVVLTGDVKRVEERYEVAKNREDALTEQLEKLKEDIFLLENSDRDASDRENESEVKIKFLETQLAETKSTIESHERNVRKQERLHDTLRDEIETWEGKREEVRHEMEEVAGTLLEGDF
ncbi:uncharacterized protein LOC114525370, partial [Dendronephthya gigantea]|uniref:uncharacterized protein LOC114525370 n=1 Tax=Dendronephthya gigantea TaxID=151771 RepID=UPI00106CF50D